MNALIPASLCSPMNLSSSFSKKIQRTSLPVSSCSLSDSMECNKKSTRVDKVSMDVFDTEFIIVRHGETEYNVLKKVQGQLDIDLNEVGRRQAEAVAVRLSKEYTIAAVYSSSLKRALDTAHVIAVKCGGIPVIPDQDLRERHLGGLQGVVYQKFAELSPKEYEAFKSPRSDIEIPGGGESRDQLHARCASSLKRIGNKHKGQRIVVVTHGAVIESLFKWVAPEEKPEVVANTSISIIQLSGDNLWSLKSCNDISHLTETGYLKWG